MRWGSRAGPLMAASSSTWLAIILIGARSRCLPAEAGSAFTSMRPARLPNVPRFTVSLNTDYAIPGVSFEPIVGATLQHISDRNVGFGADSPPRYDLPAYAMVHLRAGVTVATVNLQLYVHNLSNEHSELS